jgi:translation initiation factor 3 subunit L
MNKSNIIRVLDAERLDLSPEEKKASYGEFGVQNTYLMLGYFSLIGLTRVHCMLSDYHTALRTLDHVDVAQGGPYPQVTDCYVTLYYYMGFCYLMSRRYNDAIATFSSVLLYISRTKDYHNSRTSQYDQMMKKVDRMYALLSIAVTLSPQRIDESVHNTLRDKNQDKLQRMQRGELSAFEELFCYGCPKFVTVATPDYGQAPSQNTTQDALRRQVSIFIKEVSQQSSLPVMRSYLKLYTTIGTGKLASFLDTDEDTVRYVNVVCVCVSFLLLPFSLSLSPDCRVCLFVMLRVFVCCNALETPRTMMIGKQTVLYEHIPYYY